MIEKYYTGIGSRTAPGWALAVAFRLAGQMVKYGYILRSGGADGMDMAFEDGCYNANGESRIYLPWKGFNKNDSPYYNIDDDAMALAQSLHPNWGMLSQGARKLHARNVYQIVGHDWKYPTRCVICYSNEGTGGTMQAVRLANQMGIPVIDLCTSSYDGSLWDTSTDKGLDEIVNSVLNQVLVKKHNLRKPKKLEVDTKTLIDDESYRTYRTKAFHFIHGFQDKYRFLSNFYMSEYKLNGKSYYTVENGFQSYKTDPPDERIRVAGTPSEAKRLGRLVPLRSDWEEIKDKVMHEHVLAKFSQNDDLKQLLIKTNDAVLCEDNTWHDNYWGDCTCDKCQFIEGKNMLGKILMKVREQLRKPPFY